MTVRSKLFPPQQFVPVELRPGHFLRPAEPCDIDEIVHLITTAMNPDEGIYSRETLLTHFNQSSEQSDGRLIHALTAMERIIGVVGLHFYNWGPPENVWLSWFAVDPSHQRAGFGTQMLDAICEIALGLGHHKMFIETYSTPEFTKARQFYAKRGFDPVGIIDNYLPNSGSMVVYCRELANGSIDDTTPDHPDFASRTPRTSGGANSQRSLGEACQQATS